MSEHVVILGNGAMATVCSIVIVQSGHSATMWGAKSESIRHLQNDRENRRLLPGVRIPVNVHLTSDDAECFKHATLILSAIPTQYMRSAWERLKKYVPENVPVVSVSKGIENNTLMRPTQIIADVLDKTSGGLKNELAVLSGPNIAPELGRFLPTTAVVASDKIELAKRVQSIMRTQWFRVYTNDDMVGVELAGATKNVIAIAAGMLDGMGAGNNAKSALVTRGLVEISRLGAALGANPVTFSGLAGLGDLITTCVSPEGRNRGVGEQIGKGKKLSEVLAGMNSVAEGVATTRSVRELARKHDVQMPITEEVYSVLFDNKDVNAALVALMTRDPKPER